MKNLKRNSIQLFKEMNGEEAITETFWTTPFPPLSMVYEAADIVGEIEEIELQRIEKGESLTTKEVRDNLEKMAEFLANRVYAKQFTKEDLENRYYGPNAFSTLRDQVMFVASGVQSDETKKFLSEKKD